MTSPAARGPDHPVTAVVVTGGSPLHPGAVSLVPPDAFVIAADSGLDHALAVGMRPDLVVGDLDSVSAASLDWARRDGIPIDEYPADKDSTDTEIAIAAGLQRGIRSLILLGGGAGGDRLDHSIGAIAALGHESLAGLDSVTARWGAADIAVLHGPAKRSFAARADTTFSLLAMHGVCRGVTLTGARWPLHDATIAPGSSLGVSNLSLTDTLVVALDAGVVTVIFPNSGEPS